jgi:hypothetical protein
MRDYTLMNPQLNPKAGKITCRISAPKALIVLFVQWLETRIGHPKYRIIKIITDDIISRYIVFSMTNG